MNRQIWLFIISGLVLLLAVTGLSFYNYMQQEAALEELTGNLELQLACNEELIEEIVQLQQELNELQELYDQLLREKEDLEDGRSGDPGRGSDSGSGSPGESGPVAYLTIDDGPSKNTLEMLDILKSYGVPATFFVTGNNYSGDDGIYRRIVDAGHAIGNHTHTHQFETIYLSVNDFISDFIRLEQLIEQETGIKTNMMRFPGGTGSQMARRVSGFDIMEELIPAVQALGYDYFDWNISCGDGDSTLPAETLIANFVTQMNRRTGDDLVVLLHDGINNDATVEALPEMIEHLQSSGYSFATLYKGAINIKHR